MNSKRQAWFSVGSLFGMVVVAIGLANLFLVHPVPGIVYLLLATIFFPETNTALQQKFNFTIPALAKIFLGVFIIWFTLGVSDLGDMMD